MSLTIPTIHLNGTAQAELLEQQLQAMTAIRAAINALQHACPNSRDYPSPYRGHDVYTAAVEEHSSRLNRLVAVLNECSEIAQAIDDGGHKAF